MELPEDTVLEVDCGVLRVKGPKGSVLEKKFDPKAVKVSVEGRTVKVEAVGAGTRRTNAAVGAVEAHIRNMVKGVHDGYEKKLQLVYAHFPVTLEVKGKEIMIKNFLGEKTPRKAKIEGETKVQVKGQEIIVSGASKEDVGQTASNLIRATKIRQRDERIFQDGIYYA